MRKLPEAYALRPTTTRSCASRNEIRHAVNDWRHGAAVDVFRGRARPRARRLGRASGADPQRGQRGGAEPGLPRDPGPTRCADEAGKDCSAPVRRCSSPCWPNAPTLARTSLRSSGDVYSRAGRHLRSVKARASHAARQDTPHEETGIVEAITAETGALAAETAPEPLAPSRLAEEVATDPDRDALPDWRTLFQELKKDWNELVARSQEPDLPLLLMDGYDEVIDRVRVLVDHPNLSERVRSVLGKLLEYHDDETVARETAEGYLESAERHVEAYKVLERQARERGLPVARLEAWPKWREAAEMLAATGKAIISNDEKYGAYLDAMTIGKARAELTVEQLRSQPPREPYARYGKAGSAHRPRPEPTPKPKQEQGFAHILEERRKSEMRSSKTDEGEKQGFAHILDDPEKLRELREKAKKRDRKREKHLRRSRGLSM